MELLIVKNGHVYARATDEAASSEDSFELRMTEELPEYPQEPAGRGKYWDLDYAGNVLAWVRKDRPLTVEERLEDVEKEVKVWRPGEAVKVGDERYYTVNSTWYVCLQAHTTQADWTPDVAVSLWRVK